MHIHASSKNQINVSRFTGLLIPPREDSRKKRVNLISQIDFQLKNFFTMKIDFKCLRRAEERERFVEGRNSRSRALNNRQLSSSVERAQETTLEAGN